MEGCRVASGIYPIRRSWRPRIGGSRSIVQVALVMPKWRGGLGRS